jgi:hypothetical protein
MILICNASSEFPDWHLERSKCETGSVMAFVACVPNFTGPCEYATFASLEGKRLD